MTLPVLHLAHCSPCMPRCRSCRSQSGSILLYVAWALSEGALGAQQRQPSPFHFCTQHHGTFTSSALHLRGSNSRRNLVQLQTQCRESLSRGFSCQTLTGLYWLWVILDFFRGSYLAKSEQEEPTAPQHDPTAKFQASAPKFGIRRVY